MKKSNNNGGVKITFVGLLTCLFIGLKLLGHITWSWFWVLSPLIFSWTFVLLVLGISFVVIRLMEGD